MTAYLSICSGIEAATVAWHPLGFRPLAFSEIDPFARAVLTHHYPDVPCHGDFTALRGQPWIVDADILVGGTPCQAFSVAGLRNSLADDRGNLSLEFVRLADAIDDLRLASGREPAIIVWENVPGVLSVRDNAFGCFIAAMAGDAAPYVPPKGKWTNAGVVDGPARTVAWRILDAQYFGLAQRRRRVFVVASARNGFDPAAVLLEFEGMRRDTPPCREAGKGTAHATAPCLTSGGRGVERTGDTRGQDPVVAVMEASTAEISRCLNAGGMGRQDYETETLVAHALRAEGFDASEDGTGRGTPLVPVAFAQNTRDEVRLQGGDGQIVGSLAADPGMKQTTYVAVPLLEVGKRTGVSTDDPRAGSGIGEDGDPMFTLQAGARHGVAIAITTEQTPKFSQECALTLTKQSPTGGGQPQAVAYAFQPRIARNGRGAMGDIVNALNAQSGETGKGDAAPCVATVAVNETVGTLCAEAGPNTHGSRGVSGSQTMLSGYIQPTANMAVRRLTPTECSRLQGFPDDYLLSVTWRGKCPPPDGPMYKALGNSMAVPVMRWIGRRIAAALEAA